MTMQDMIQEIEKDPVVPLRLHLSSGKTIDIRDPHTAWVQQTTLLIVHPLRPKSQAIGRYEVIALRVIERVEQVNGKPRHNRGRRGGA